MLISYNYSCSIRFQCLKSYCSCIHFWDIQ